MNSATVHKPRLAGFASAALCLAVAAAFAGMWRWTEELFYAPLAASFLLRAPVAFNHPITGSTFINRLGKRLANWAGYSNVEVVLSIASLLLLVATIIVYTVSPL